MKDRRLGMALVALCCLASFGRTFNGWEWLIPAAAGAAIASLATGALSRRLWPATAVATSTIAGAWFILLVVEPSATRFGFPTIGGIRRAIDSGMAAWSLSKEAIAPIDPLPGLLILLIGAVWLASSVSTGLGRSGWHTLALLPWLGLFTYASAVGIPEGRMTSVVLFASAMVTYLFLSGTNKQEDPRPAVRTGAIAIAAAVVFTPLVPGYGSPPIVSMSPSVSAQGTRLAPFEFISAQLRDDEVNVMFTVRSDRATYWRLAALDSYDGRTWAKGLDLAKRIPLTRTVDDDPGTIVVRQKVTIHDLRGQWVPMGFRPIAVNGIETLQDPLRDTVYTDALRGRTSYFAVSAVPNPSRTTLERVPAPLGAQTRRYLGLPAQIRPEIAQIAQSIAGELPTPYEKAVAIQEHLRSFRYTLEIPRLGHSDDDLVTLLTSKKEGYCENFAGAMAVMLRTLGIPSRVAIGFLPGAEKGGTFTVTNKDAHAWVEAWLGGAGWVAFEPTPRSEAVPASYATAASLDPGGPPDPETVHPAPAAPVTPPSPAPTDLPPVTEGTEEPIAVRAAIRTAAGLGSIALILLLMKQVWMRAPYLRARGNVAAKARAAHRELETRASDVFRAPRRDETETEFSQALRERFALDEDAVRAVILPSLEEAYSGRTSDDAHAADAVAAMKRLRSEIAHKAGPGGRLMMSIGPAPMIAGLTKVLSSRGR